jgi:GDP-L-fucose synthase
MNFFYLEDLVDMHTNDRIYVAGHKGLVGSAIVRKLRENGFKNLILKTRSELDLTDSLSVSKFFEKESPDYVFLAAARCGGIGDNQNRPVEFLQTNLEIQNNIIKCSHKQKVKKLLFLGSSCIYPKECPQPMKEEYLLSGYLEPTNESYSIAKIAGIKLCQAYRKQYGDNFISIQPCNVYGPLDKFDTNTGHVIGSLLAKFHNAKKNDKSSVTCWGTGAACREFIYVDDLADACLFLMLNYEESDIINVGPGVDYSIKDLAEIIKSITGYTGSIEWDSTKPDGMMRKLLDISKLKNLGWTAPTSLETGLQLTYSYYKLEAK